MGRKISSPADRLSWSYSSLPLGCVAPYATGRGVTDRDLRFMVSADEVTGLQGWCIRRLGGFPVDTKHPAITTLRHGIDILQQRETGDFPEAAISAKTGGAGLIGSNRFSPPGTAS